MASSPTFRAVIVMAVLATALGACRGRSTPPPTEDGEGGDQIVPVTAQPAQVGALRATIHLSGLVVPADGAEFLAIAPEPARVVEVTRNQGEPVSSGDILVRFELTSATQEVARQQAEVARLQAQFENARISRERVSDFVSRGMVPRNDLAQTDRELSEAQGMVAAAQNALKRAQDALAKGTVRAPFSGIVATRLHNPGDLAQASFADPVVRVVDPARLEILAAVPGSDASRVAPGASARIAGFVDGKAVALSVASRPGGTPDSEGKLRARLAFTEQPTMMVDTPVEVDVDAEERTGVVFVPPIALVTPAPDAAVFVVVDSVAQRRAVKTGVTTDQGVEITAGLRAGELVITRGQGSVKDGTLVTAEIVR